MPKKITIQHIYQEVGQLIDNNYKSNDFMKLHIPLDFKINRLRQKLVKTGIEKGLSHQVTLKYSQRLDKLIIKSLFLKLHV